MYYNTDKLRKEHLRLMAEPDDVRKLRRQAEAIRASKALAARKLRNEFEKDKLRREIRSAGETPVA